MNIYSLMENTPYRPEFSAEHGLSLYIEAAGHHILFDFGQTGAFADNAERLGIDLGKVDIAILSHGHYDHGGGIARFLALNDHAPIYLSRHAFGAYFNGAGKYIGLAPELVKSGRLVFTEGDCKLDDALTLCVLPDHAFSSGAEIDSAGLTEKRNGALIPDSFRHEQYLCIRDGERSVLFSGCSHKGILNIMAHLHPDLLVGGFHLMKQELREGGNPTLDRTAELLSGYDAVYYTCHCTGGAQFAYLKEKMGERLHYLASGQTLTM